MRKTKVMSKDVLAEKLQEVLQGVKKKDARRKIVAILKEDLRLEEKTQMLPYEQRAVVWMCSYFVFNYLRTNGLIQREPGKFDDNVKEILKELR